MADPRDSPVTPSPSPVMYDGMMPSIIAPLIDQNSQLLNAEPPPLERAKSSPANLIKFCWICFATEEEDVSVGWVKPCNCKGTTKWVHQQCIQQWIDEKQKDGRDRKVVCPQCRTEYLIYYPKSSYLVMLLDKIDALIYKLCPFVAVVLLIGSIYWTAVTYGAVTMIQVAGQEEAIPWMDQVEPAVLLTTLPAIPLAMIALKASKWEDSSLHFIRYISPGLPLLNYFLPAPVRNETGVSIENRITEGMSCTRVFTGALLLPTVATICGNSLFSNITSPWQRALVGGLTFIAVRGLVKMYHKHQIYKRISTRRILDYTEENIIRANSLSNAARPRQARPQVPSEASA